MLIFGQPCAREIATLDFFFTHLIFLKVYQHIFLMALAVTVTIKREKTLEVFGPGFSFVLFAKGD